MSMAVSHRPDAIAHYLVRNSSSARQWLIERILVVSGGQKHLQWDIGRHGNRADQCADFILPPSIFRIDSLRAPSDGPMTALNAPIDSAHYTAQVDGTVVAIATTAKCIAAGIVESRFPTPLKFCKRSNSSTFDRVITRVNVYGRRASTHRQAETYAQHGVD